MLLVAVLILGVLAWLNLRSAGTVLYPPALLSAYWAVLLLALLLSGDAFYPLSHFTIFIFVSAIGAFAMGGGIARAILVRSRRLNRIPDPVALRRHLNVGLIALVVFTPFYALLLQQLAADSGDTEFWRGIRYKTSVEVEDGFGLYAYPLSIATFLSLAYFADYRRLEGFKWRGRFLVAVSSLMLLASMGRTNLALLLFGALGVLWVRQGKVTWKPLALASAAGLAAFIFVAVVLQKGGSADSTFADNARSIAQNMQLYFLGGFVAFDQFVSGNVHLGDSPRTLRFVYRVLRSLGLETPPLDIIEKYAAVPGPTNVYTMLLPSYADFGYVGVVVVMGLLGFACTWVFLRAREGDRRYVVTYGLVFAAIMLGLAQEHFLVSTSRWIQLWLFLIVFFRFKAPRRVDAPLPAGWQTPPPLPHGQGAQ